MILKAKNFLELKGDIEISKCGEFTLKTIELSGDRKLLIGYMNTEIGFWLDRVIVSKDNSHILNMYAEDYEGVGYKLIDIIKKINNTIEGITIDLEDFENYIVIEK